MARIRQADSFMKWRKAATTVIATADFDKDERRGGRRHHHHGHNNIRKPCPQVSAKMMKMTKTEKEMKLLLEERQTKWLSPN